MDRCAEPWTRQRWIESLNPSPELENKIGPVRAPVLTWDKLRAASAFIRLRENRYDTLVKTSWGLDPHRITATEDR